LAGSKITLLNRALIAETLGALEEELHALAAAKTAHCIGVTCQVLFSFIDVQFTGLASPFFLVKIVSAAKYPTVRINFSASSIAALCPRLKDNSRLDHPYQILRVLRRTDTPFRRA